MPHSYLAHMYMPHSYLCHTAISHTCISHTCISHTCTSVCLSTCTSTYPLGPQRSRRARAKTQSTACQLLCFIMQMLMKQLVSRALQVVSSCTNAHETTCLTMHACPPAHAACCKALHPVHKANNSSSPSTTTMLRQSDMVGAGRARHAMEIGHGDRSSTRRSAQRMQAGASCWDSVSLGIVCHLAIVCHQNGGGEST